MTAVIQGALNSPKCPVTDTSILLFSQIAKAKCFIFQTQTKIQCYSAIQPIYSGQYTLLNTGTSYITRGHIKWYNPKEGEFGNL